MSCCRNYKYVAPLALMERGSATRSIKLHVHTERWSGSKRTYKSRRFLQPSCPFDMN